MSAKRLLFVLIIIGLIVASFMLPVADTVIAVVDWSSKAGFLGMAAFAGLYILATVAMFPGLILTLTAGFLYGPLVGIAIISPASVIGATLAFLLGRYALRDWVSAKISKNLKFSQIDEAIALQGFRIVGLLRLSPIFPFNLLNYSLGLTKVSLGSYVLASFLGMLPGTLMYIYLGSLATSLSEAASGQTRGEGPWQTVLYVAGLIATIVVTIVITKIAKNALKEQLRDKNDANK